MDQRYIQRGVSAMKEDVHAAIKNIDKGLYPQAFCKIIPDILGGDPQYCNIMHADGAGTKTSLAYAYWRETGDLSVWKGIAQDALIMNTDDLLCVGAVDNILVSSTIGRNKMLIPGEVISAIINGTDQLLAWMREMGIGIHATGGETADVGDLVRTVIVDSTVTCRMRRADVIDNANIRPGDVIVGLASFGQATYEDTYNGGMGSNGLTSARHDIFAKYLAERYPETYDHAVPQELVYSGHWQLTSPAFCPSAKAPAPPSLSPSGLPAAPCHPSPCREGEIPLKEASASSTAGAFSPSLQGEGRRSTEGGSDGEGLWEGLDVGRLVLSPTRTYAPFVRRMLQLVPRCEIHGMVHCTGGAQTKVLHFVGPRCRVVKDNMFPLPPLFRLIHDESHADWSEMYRVFNMGHRLEVYVRPEQAPQIIDIAQSFNIAAQVVGHIEEGPRSLTIKSQFGEFEYK